MDKKSFRVSCINKLKKIGKKSHYLKDKKVNRWLYKKIKSKKCKVVMLYIPLKIEINISDLIKWLRKENVTVLVPFMVGKSFRLVEYRLPLNIKKFSIKEPNISNKIYKKIDLAIVPIIGIDKEFRRIGFGKGFYDRFFEVNSAYIKEVLFIGREACIASENITDNYDVQGDSYVTSNKVFIKNNSKNNIKKKSRSLLLE